MFKTLHQNMWYEAEVVLRGKCKTLNGFIRKKEISQSYCVIFYLKIQKQRSS